MRANFPPGISLEKSAEMASKIRAHSASDSPKCKLVSSQTGRNDSGTDPYGPNRNEFFVALKPYEPGPGTHQGRAGREAFANALQTEIPGAFFSFTQPIIDNVTEAVTGSPADLAVIISGPDWPSCANSPTRLWR